MVVWTAMLVVLFCEAPHSKDHDINDTRIMLVGRRAVQRFNADAWVFRRNGSLQVDPPRGVIPAVRLCSAGLVAKVMPDNILVLSLVEAYNQNRHLGMVEQCCLLLGVTLPHCGCCLPCASA